MTPMTTRDGTPSVARPRWYLVQLRPNQRAIAERNLTNQGCRLFCPLEVRPVQRRGPSETALRLLFPGYLFASFDVARVRWTAVNSTRGVARLVSFRPHEPAEVPLSLVASLMQRCDEVGRLRPPAILNPGDQVKIVAGPFSDFVATVETLAPDRRVWVMLELMDRITRVAVAAADLRMV